DVDSSTQYQGKATSFSGLAVGDLVEVAGTLNQDGSVQAATVDDLGPPPPREVHVFGVIQSIGTNSFEVVPATATPQPAAIPKPAPVTVDVDSGTQYRDKATSFSSLAVGDLVYVEGTATGTNELQASMVADFGAPPAR
ncbi:MAG TPA: DUF5666 domain-containing protein, partial [Myxococcales bacterium]|nr:DUF5666 domain-containing protein [Myxococcales bacterium]